MGPQAQAHVQHKGAHRLVAALAVPVGSGRVQDKVVVEAVEDNQPMGLHGPDTVAHRDNRCGGDAGKSNLVGEVLGSRQVDHSEGQQLLHHDGEGYRAGQASSFHQTSVRHGLQPNPWDRIRTR